MAALTERRSLRQCTTRRQWAALALAGLGLAAMVAAWHSTAKAGGVPVGSSPFIDSQADSQAQAPLTTTATLFPFLDMVPSQDGREIYVSAGRMGELGGTVFANIGIGPGHNKGGWTMTYSDTVRGYITTVPGFTPSFDDNAPISITTTLGLDTGSVMFNRAYVQAFTPRSISSLDGGNLTLELVSADTFTVSTYILVVPSYALPGSVPAGHRLVSRAYSVRAGGALAETARPMLLQLNYDEDALAGADPHTLAIFRWDASQHRWENVGGDLFADEHSLSLAVSQFATYALMATTTWREDFLSDFSLSGLDEEDNVQWDMLGGGLVLSGTATSGHAVTKPITPTAGISSWGSVSFSCSVASPTQTLTVDVLSLEGSEVLTGVASGTDLAGLVDATRYPSLRLRVNMASTVAGETPALAGWQLAWQAGVHRIYLPAILKRK